MSSEVFEAHLYFRGNFDKAIGTDGATKFLSEFQSLLDETKKNPRCNDSASLYCTKSTLVHDVQVHSQHTRPNSIHNPDTISITKNPDS